MLTKYIQTIVIFILMISQSIHWHENIQINQKTINQNLIQKERITFRNMETNRMLTLMVNTPSTQEQIQFQSKPSANRIGSNIISNENSDNISYHITEPTSSINDIELTVNGLDSEIEEYNQAQETDLEIFEDSDYSEYISDYAAAIIASNGKAISNFSLRITKIIEPFDQANDAKFEGYLILSKCENKVIPPTSVHILYNASKLKRLIRNLSPLQTNIHCSDKEFIKAIHEINPHDACSIIKEKEFGYNSDLTTYNTAELQISSEGIVEVNQPIVNSNNAQELQLLNPMQVDEEIKTKLIERLLEWERPEVVYSGLAFTMLPVIYPFIKEKYPEKFYLMYSGSYSTGKSETSKLFQNFYGEFNTLNSWTNTASAISIVGNSFKDAILVMDDLKFQNFKDAKSVNEAMTLLQNYGDCNSRKRANGAQQLQKDRQFNSFILMNGEDFFFTEPSTLSRGIFIRVEPKPFSTKIKELKVLSRSFSAITADYIHYVLKYHSSKKLMEIISGNIEYFQQLITTMPDVNGITPRYIDNLVMLKTSWDTFAEYYFPNKEAALEHNLRFQNSLRNILIENLELTNSMRPERSFESTLWSLVEQKQLYFEKVDPDNKIKLVQPKGKLAGYYTIIDSKLRLALNLKTVRKEVSKDIPGFDISYDGLKQRLHQDHKIIFNKSEKVFLGNNVHRAGVEWVGRIPLELFDQNDYSQLQMESQEMHQHSLGAPKLLTEPNEISEATIIDEGTIS